MASYYLSDVGVHYVHVPFNAVTTVERRPVQVGAIPPEVIERMRAIVDGHAELVIVGHRAHKRMIDKETKT